ncbi:unnamed protein product, partial [Polarella glacialis]
MSTLEGAARYMYGSWAAKGLRATSMVATNIDNFWEVRCHKLLICDPKDTMILDLAALRTALALRFLEGLAPEERITIEDPKLLRLAEVWRFFGALFTICEEEEDMIGFQPGKPARQPGFADPLRPEVRMKVVDGLDQPSGPRGSSAISGGSSSSSSGLQGGTASQGNSIACERVGLQWLEDNAGLVRTCMAPLADQVRSALDLVGEGLEGGGVTLSDVLLDNPGNPCW